VSFDGAESRFAMPPTSDGVFSPPAGAAGLSAFGAFTAAGLPIKERQGRRNIVSIRKDNSKVEYFRS